MLKHLTDTTPVGGHTASSASHGALFYATFRKVLSGHLVERAGTSTGSGLLGDLMSVATKHPGVVGTILTGTLDHVATHRELRKRYGVS